MSFTQFTTTIDSKGYINMDEVIAFLDSLPRVQQAIIASHMMDKILSHAGNKYEVNDQLIKSVNVMAANFMYGLG